MFTPQDLEQMSAHGISREKVEQQIEYFKSGFPALDIVQCATIGKGIVRMDDEQVEEYMNKTGVGEKEGQPVTEEVEEVKTEEPVVEEKPVKKNNNCAKGKRTA